MTTLLHFQDIPANETAVYTKALSDRLQGFKGAEFSLFFANCADDTQVSFEVTARMYNVKGDRKDFLGVGEDALPLLYMVGAMVPPCTTHGCHANSRACMRAHGRQEQLLAAQLEVPCCCLLHSSSAGWTDPTPRHQSWLYRQCTPL